MNGERIFELLGNIDDCWILEAQEMTTTAEAVAADVTSSAKVLAPRVPSSDLEKSAPKGRSTASAASAPTLRSRLKSFYASGWPVAIAAILLFIMGIGVILKGMLTKNPETEMSDATHSSPETQVMMSQRNETGAGPTEAWGVNESTPDGGTETDPASGGVGAIPKIPEDRTIVLTGKPITDEEAAAYFETEFSFICEGLRTMGVSLTDPHISSKGYCYLQYGTYEGEGLTVHQDSRDYPLYDGDELKAIVTLFRDQEDGSIHNSPSFGGDWMKGYGEWLAAHKGQELLFVRAGNTEFILAQNDDCMNPSGMSQDEIDQYFEGIAYPMELLYCEAATYTP
ncbi:MAG: hypothetical protein J5636_09580 [Clostridiales bacterium]|nr:hypothetical protein [Clostridiales bacterium]